MYPGSRSNLRGLFRFTRSFPGLFESIVVFPGLFLSISNDPSDHIIWSLSPPLCVRSSPLFRIRSVSLFRIRSVHRLTSVVLSGTSSLLDYTVVPVKCCSPCDLKPKRKNQIDSGRVLMSYVTIRIMSFVVLRWGVISSLREGT